MTENNNYKIVSFEKFYKALEPNITSAKSGILFFNSDSETLDNAAPQKIQDLKRKSAIHSNLIDLKSSLIATPAGLFPVEDNNDSLNTFLKQKNRKGETINTVFKNCAADMALYEQAFIEVIFSKEGKIAEIYQKSVNDIRLEEPDDLGIIQNYYYSNSWGLVSNKRDKKKVNDIANAIKIPAFNPETISSSGGKQILHLKKYASGCDNEYPIPSYLSAEYFINVAYSISQYVLNKFEGGYFMDGFLYLNSNMSEEQKNQFVQDFRQKHEGTKGKKVVFVFGDTAVSKPEFVPIGDTLGNAAFKDYMLEATKQICFAHSANLNLLGLSNSDTFGAQGDASNINVSRLQYINDVIIPYQQVLIEGFNRIFEINGLGEATLLNDSLKLTIPKLLDTDTTEDERREMVLGLSPKLSGSTSTNNIITTPAA